ncbi:8888_t:CDS:2 [Cetraspora pellucida]|uniref:8888_t:CDS:1 n=1 Tax=Cetraspora pellucida TaxID=1433469 RepID=A0ACA9LNU7_9GLOM|nr:8888_t:CDS:2 [Cetraspora pellucida]
MTLENEIIFNKNNTVSVPFGHIAESYILHYFLLKNTCLKFQSCLQTPQLIKEGLITLCHVEDKGREYVQEIQTDLKKDKLCWSWIMYCAGDKNHCQHKYGSIGKCLLSCQNYNLNNNLRNRNNMHHCSVHVYLFSRLSYFNLSHLLQIKIEGTHLPTNIINNVSKISRINLMREVQDKIIVSYHADH